MTSRGRARSMGVLIPDCTHASTMNATPGALADAPVLAPSGPGDARTVRPTTVETLPATDELHAWLIDLDAPAGEAEAACLSPSERSRASRLLRAEQRRRWVTCRLAVRRILGGYLRMPPESVPLDRGPSGKPFVRQSANPQELRFNLSHSGGLGLLVVGVDVEVGVDIEVTRPLRAFENLVLRCLADEERLAIRCLPPQDRQRSFLRYWTHKEAFLKAIGSGLSRPLPSVVVDLSRPDARTEHGADGPASRLSDRSGIGSAAVAQVCEISLPLDGYGAVVWLDTSPRRILERHWPPEQAPTRASAADLDAERRGEPSVATARATPPTRRSPEEIVDWIAEFLSRDAGVPAGSIDTAASFETFGLDSAVAIEMTGDLERWLGISVDPMLLYDHPTIDALAGHLAARFDGT